MANKTNNIRKTGTTPEGAMVDQVPAGVRTKVQGILLAAQIRGIGKSDSMVALDPQLTDSPNSGTTLAGIPEDGSTEIERHLFSVMSRALRNDNGNYSGTASIYIGHALAAPSPGEMLLTGVLQATAASTYGLQRGIDSAAKKETAAPFSNIEKRHEFICKRVNSDRQNYSGKVTKTGARKGILPLYDVVGLVEGPLLVTGISSNGKKRTTANALATLTEKAAKQFAHTIAEIDALLSPWTAVQSTDAPKVAVKSSATMLALPLVCTSAAVRAFRASIGLEGRGSASEHIRQCGAALVEAGLLSPDMVAAAPEAAAKVG